MLPLLPPCQPTHTHAHAQPDDAQVDELFLDNGPQSSYFQHWMDHTQKVGFFEVCVQLVVECLVHARGSTQHTHLNPPNTIKLKQYSHKHNAHTLTQHTQQTQQVWVQGMHLLSNSTTALATSPSGRDERVLKQLWHYLTAGVNMPDANVVLSARKPAYFAKRLIYSCR